MKVGYFKVAYIIFSFYRPIICCSCGYYLLSFFLLLFPSPILSRRRLDVYHTSTHDVALVRV